MDIELSKPAKDSERTRAMEGNEPPSFSQKYFWPLALAQFSYLFGLTSLHSIGWFHYLLDERMDLELIYVGGYLYLTCTTFVQLFVSHYMDNMQSSTVSKFGRRKPFILAGFFVVALSIFIMCFPPNTESITLGEWWCVFGTLGQCAADVMNLSLTAWLLENAHSQEDYLRITTKIKTVSQVIGHVLAIGLTRYVPHGPFIASGIYLFVGTVSVFLIFRIPRSGVVVTKETLSQPPILPSIRIAVNSSSFRKLVASLVMLLSGRDVVAVSCLYLFQFEDYPEVQTYKDFGNWFFYLTIISTSLGVISAIVMDKYLKTTDKYFTYRVVIYAYIAMAAAMIPCTIIRSAGSFSVIFSVLCCYAVLNNCVDILRDMMTRDLLVVDHFCTGMNREAMYLTAVNIPLTLVRAFIGALPLLLIPASGYKLVDDVDDDALDSRMDFTNFTIWLVRSMTSGYLVFASAALYFFWGYQINDEKVIAINDEMNLRAKSAMEKSHGSNNDRSFHVNGLKSEVITMLNLSPVENRALAKSDRTSDVLSKLVQHNYAQLFLACSSSALLLSLFVFVCVQGSDTWTFLIVFLFLICSSTGLYCLFRFGALARLRRFGLEEITDAAIMAEEQRSGDKTMHLLLSEGGGNLTLGSTNLPSMVATHNPMSYVDSVATSSGLVTSSSAIEERADEYARDNFVLDNTVVSLCLGTVNIAAIVTFYLLSR